MPARTISVARDPLVVRARLAMARAIQRQESPDEVHRLQLEHDRQKALAVIRLGRAMLAEVEDAS